MITVSATRYSANSGYRAECFATQDMAGRPALTWQDGARTQRRRRLTRRRKRAERFSTVGQAVVLRDSRADAYGFTLASATTGICVLLDGLAAVDASYQARRLSHS